MVGTLSPVEGLALNVCMCPYGQSGGSSGGGGLRVRGAAGTGGVRRAPGFQPALAALQQGLPHPVAALTINSSYGL